MRSNLYKVAALILLGALSKGELPEDDFRIINRQDLLATDSDIFEDNGAKSFSQLLFDVARDQVLVGARDTLYRLSLRGLRQLERAHWPAPADKAKLCQDKGQTEEDCHNYVKVLLSYGHKLFACGTNAFSPICSWREIESLNMVSEWVPGVAHCPHNPHSNVTAILTTGGEYYAGTPTDFTSSETTICRSRGAAPRDPGMLRTTQYDLNWLNEPQFVGSFEDDHFVYFVFREVAVEYMNCGKTIYSRVARVCKNDSGGHMVMKDNWTTFLKARLSCSVPGDVPFHYDEVQGVEYLPQEKMLVAIFTTPTNSIAGSAVCIYNMSDVHAAFEGPFKVQDSPLSTWEPRALPRPARDHFRCATDTRSHSAIEYQRYHLMYESIQPISGEPVYKAVLERFTHVTVDVASAKNVGKQLVVFVATQRSDVLKLAVLPRYDGACAVEVWRLRDARGGHDVRTMQFVKDTMSLYIGSDTAILRIGSERCARYKSRSGCVGAGDPHCGWDDARDVCVRASAHAHAAYFTQSTGSCPSDNTLVDGGWSSWSEWETCMQANTPHSPYSDDKPDACLCRTRRCDNPRPQHGGQNCEGASIAVANCTVHGGWSAWSGWSECSASCGIAVKSRRRACSSPEPRFGGRVCVGLDVQDLYCANLPPCPGQYTDALRTWSGWSECSASCGIAVKSRRHACSSPEPRFGGRVCVGLDVQDLYCANLPPCPGQYTDALRTWSGWSECSASCGIAVKSRRRACSSPEPRFGGRVCVGLDVQDLYCANLPPCPGQYTDALRTWSGWSECSASCGIAVKSRRRACSSPEPRFGGRVCVGLDVQDLYCANLPPCPGQYTDALRTWSGWSECSASCGIAVKSRRRACSSPEPRFGGRVCVGLDVQDLYCANLPPCPGQYTDALRTWSGWSECSASCGIAVKSRRRACSSPEPRFGGRVCVGLDVQDLYCANLPPCPDPTLAPVDGGWSPWGAWSPCTGAGCGSAAGYRERRRACASPAPQHGGADCDGPRSERQPCDLRPCEVRKATAWTPWVQIPGNSSDGSYTEKRFKFLCKAPTPEQIRLSLAREEERYCTQLGACSSAPPEEGGWEAWGAWGACSAACGGGQQARTRRCRHPPCAGAPDMLRACNTHACVGEWSCWSEWSECSGDCESGAPGHRARTRMCLSPEGCADAGAALERRVCVNNCADSEAGWGAWGEWGACESGERVRRRQCEAGACVGPQLQVARCDPDADLDNELHAMPAYSQNVEMASFVTMARGDSLSVGAIVGCVVAAFVMGCLVCLAVVIFCHRRGALPWRSAPRVPSSPHYITAKQNSYVTVPLKDIPRKAKRQPSFTGIGNSSGILLSKSNNLSAANNHNIATTPKLYPKAIASEYDSMGTLRRHSAQPNNKPNMDAEEDKFY